MDEQFIVGPDDHGRRLDRVLRKTLKAMPLSAIHRLLRTGKITLDEKIARGDSRVSTGTVLRVRMDIEALKKASPVQQGVNRKSLSPEDPSYPSLEIIWESESLLALGKPAGIAVHGEKSLEKQVLHYMEGKGTSSLSFRPGPLHRLDRPTSGLVFFSKNLLGAQHFSLALRERRIGKRYLAIVDGTVGEVHDWMDQLGRKKDSETQRAETRVYPLVAKGGFSLILAEIRTGRTHQIRRQGALHRHPLAGDTKYGGTYRPGGFLLHAYEMDFSGARELGTPIFLQAPLQKSFLNAITMFFGEKITHILESQPPTDELLGVILT